MHFTGGTLNDPTTQPPPRTPQHSARHRIPQRTRLRGGDDAGRYGRHDDGYARRGEPCSSRGCSLRIYARRGHRHRLPHAHAAHARNRSAQTAPAHPCGRRRGLPEDDPRFLRRAQGRPRRRPDDARHGRVTHGDGHERRRDGGRLPEPHGPHSYLCLPRDVQPHHREQGTTERPLRCKRCGQCRL